MLQDWLYEDGEDATKAAYVAKMDEIRFVSGPIIARYMDKVEEERQAALKVEEEKAAKKKADLEEQRKAAEEAKKASSGAAAATAGAEKDPDVEMADTAKDSSANGPEVSEVD